MHDLTVQLNADGVSEESEEAAQQALIGVAGVIVAIGLITMLISSCGWLGACKQNTCLLFTVKLFVLLLVVNLVEGLRHCCVELRHLIIKTITKVTSFLRLRSWYW